MGTFFMKNYFFCVGLFFIVSSCGIFGNEKVVPNESAVLSGPPLAIPPDFDINNSPVDNTGIPSIDIIDQEDNENFANIPTLDQETPYVFENSQETIEMLDSGTIQDFETYDPINQQVFVPQQKGNNETKFSRKKERVAVPSDAYDIDISTLRIRNQQTRNSKNYFKSENNSFTKNIKIENNQNLSKEEESLLKEIIIEDFETSDDIKDFETRGDSD